ncbi:unnamed protein product, partial [Sphacelaria rigidula]
LTEPDEPGIYAIRRFSTPVYALDLQCPETGMHMGGPRPLPYDAVLGGLKPTTPDFVDFRTFGTRAKLFAETPPVTHLISDNTRSRSAARTTPSAPPPPTTPSTSMSHPAQVPRTNTQSSAKTSAPCATRREKSSPRTDTTP